jgi:hypothetical protein
VWGTVAAQRFRKKTSIQEQISVLATWLGDQKAGMTCGAVERPIIVTGQGIVVSTDRIAGAKTEPLECPVHQSMKA